MQIAYMGFSQRGSIRSYQFERIPERGPGQIPKHVPLSITADMAIVTRLRVKFQDVPALCMRTLRSALETRDESYPEPGSYALSEADVNAYCASVLPNPGHSDHRKRFRPKPGPSSQLQWAKTT